MTIDLKQFCADAWSYREEFKEPFGIGDKAYATDSNIMVEIDRTTEPDGPDYLQQKVPAVMAAVTEVVDFITVPEFAHEPKKKDCSFCEGHGSLAFCHLCYGTGGQDGNECDRCNGDGLIPDKNGQEVCDECNGEGSFDVPTSVQFGLVLVQAKYLKMISTLPQAAIGIPFSDDKKPIPFVFSGGRGVVMPMTSKSEDHIDLTEKIKESA